MRQHLLKCLQEGQLTQFPVKKTCMSSKKLQLGYYSSLCLYRMPEVSGVEMTECSNCKTWYHIPFCISVPIDKDYPGQKGVVLP